MVKSLRPYFSLEKWLLAPLQKLVRILLCSFFGSVLRSSMAFCVIDKEVQPIEIVDFANPSVQI